MAPTTSSRTRRTRSTWCTGGRARLVAGDASVAVGPGSVVFVPADEAHRFVDVTEELEVLVVFVPADSAG